MWQRSVSAETASAPDEDYWHSESSSSVSRHDYKVSLTAGLIEDSFRALYLNCFHHWITWNGTTVRCTLMSGLVGAPIEKKVFCRSRELPLVDTVDLEVMISDKSSQIVDNVPISGCYTSVRRPVKAPQYNLAVY